MSGEQPWIAGDLTISAAVMAEIEAHALETYPKECCGFVMGPAGVGHVIPQKGGRGAPLVPSSLGPSLLVIQLHIRRQADVIVVLVRIVRRRDPPRSLMQRRLPVDQSGVMADARRQRRGEGGPVVGREGGVDLQIGAARVG